jgi:hypothetical protein
MFSFQPGAGAPRRIADGIDRLIAQPSEELTQVREAVVAFSRQEWTWDRTADRLLDAARAPRATDDD